MTLTLSVGPAGMSAEGNGVTWAVPKTLTADRVPFTLRATAPTGLSITRTYTLDMTDQPPPLLEVTAKPDAGLGLKTRTVVVGSGVTAAPFDATWNEYLKGTGLKPVAWADDKREVKLSANAVAEPVVGGNGRFLVFRSLAKKTVEVVNLATGTRAFEAPISDGEKALAAANRTHLFVADGVNKKIDRYDLAAGTKDMTADLNRDHTVTGLTAPAGGDAPLVMGVLSPATEHVAIDPNTLKRLPTAVPLPAADLQPEGGCR